MIDKESITKKIYDLSKNKPVRYLALLNYLTEKGVILKKIKTSNYEETLGHYNNSSFDLMFKPEKEIYLAVAANTAIHSQNIFNELEKILLNKK